MTTIAGAPIVVGADGSAQSLRAVEAAATEAALRHRPLRVVHAYAWPPADAGSTSGAARRISRERAERIVDDAVRLAGKVAPDVLATTRIVTGDPAAALPDQSRDAYLLVLGDRGAGGFTGLVLGSVATRTASHAACPVLVVRGARLPSGPVVAGVDGSSTSALALEFAVDEASRRGTGLVAVHVWHGERLTELNESLPMSYESWSGEPEGRRVLAEAVAGLAERYPDVPIRREVRHGSPRRLLTQWSSHAQLVVVGNRGHGGFTGLLLGSVSQHLIHRGACPVAVVRPAPVPAGTR